MNDKALTKQPTQLERLSDSCLAFRLLNLFVSDNRFLFISPQGDFCRTCFQRRYLTQMMNNVKTIHLHSSVLDLAIKLDEKYKKNKLWQVYSVTEKKLVMSFELTPYEDCPACGKPEMCSSVKAKTLYEELLGRKSTPKLETLKKQVFSFGFARSSATTKKIGLANSKLDKLLGDGYEARILFRMIASDGRHADDSAMGFSKSNELAELKSLMEYM